MKRKTIEDIQVAGKRVLVRVDFNVPLDGRQRITDETRITAALGTLKELLARGASLVLMSHLGRPDGKVAPAMSLKPVAERLAQHLGRPVDLAPDCVGQEVERLAAGLQPGQVLMLENLRFHPEEEANDPEFARRFAALGEVYVNDAFGTAHRAHASTEGVAHHLAVVASGRLMEQEVRYLKDVLQQPRRPLVAILGGAKVSGKIELIKHLLTKVDSLLIGGGMAYTFFKALGLEIGNSLLDAKQVETARQTLEQAKTRGVEFLLPVDCAVADRFATDAQTQVVDREQIPPGWQGMDIGPRTRRLFAERVGAAGAAIWNGPLGVCEMDPFVAGTREVAEALARATAERGTLSIIGGGDTAGAIAQLGLSAKMTHVSTGGGASLECLSGLVLPGVAVLEAKGG
ncbi:MAG: phosphoglycerate kinase [Candidatus Handelsmanbacteria bacterium]|nr:phosphoglycerate kinase [Candidatus Handelsmanbacteria bacterium]